MTDPKPLDERIQTLPLWAQKLIRAQDDIIKQLRRENHQLNQCHDVLRSKNWFTIPGPKEKFLPEKGDRHLWVIYDDQPFPICSLGENDALLLGRDKKTFLMGLIEEEEQRGLESTGLDAIAIDHFQSLLEERGWRWDDEQFWKGLVKDA